MPLLAIDCFSGCGGLSEGLKRAKFKLLAGIEISEKGREAHKINHHTVRLYGDIKKIDPFLLITELKLANGELDLLAGCPPCQGFSTMRTLNGSDRIKDARNRLIFEFVRLASFLQPKTILIENVPALLTDWRLKEAKRRLRKAGYKWIKSGILNAAQFKVPQRRRRMILIASRLGPIELPKPETSSPVTVKHVIGRLMEPSKSRNRLHQMFMNHSSKVMRRIKRIPLDGGSHGDLGKRHQLQCHMRTNGFKDVYGRMRWNTVAPTITRFCHNPSKGRFLHPVQDRAITIYEAMRLQSFPSTYKFPKDMCMGEIASLIGEALPPKFAEAQARHIRKHLLTYERKGKSSKHKRLAA
ncbi:MAG TPA: DNA cytosine methyltransferase [Candidatus Methylacidiphilales bacterium]|jgi:DNA (cytosine-5)-methyltransferase 1|nr:DNA cytosine methyltransferase [Candidatus Methylacidiphilales bacterium]